MTESRTAVDPDAGTDAAEHWAPPWTPEQRESFYDAIARNQRASWQVAAVTLAGALLVAVIVASLMSPLLYAAAGLVLDLVNLAAPAPDLFEAIGRQIDGVSEGTVTPGAWLKFGVLAALPGMLLMALVLLALARAVRASADVSASGLLLRDLLPGQLEERRFGNVIAEMALAAQVPEPRVRVTHRDALNAAVLGAPDGQPVIVITRRLLQSLDRDQMQGIAAHLVACAANGDLRNGYRVAVAMALFGLMAKMATGFADRTVTRTLLGLALAALSPSPARAAALVGDLANPFGSDVESTPGSAGSSASRVAASRPAALDTSNTLTWREWAWMPLSGPLAMSGFFAGIVSSFVLGPLVALVWRRRKYLADATAVRLTRDPDTLASALSAMQQERGGVLAPAAGHFCVVRDSAGSGSGGGLFAGAIVPFFPSPERRLKALAAQGATVRLVDKPVPLLAWLIGVPVGALLVALMGTVIYLLMVVSVMLSALFTMLPAVALHALLRWVAT